MNDNYFRHKTAEAMREIKRRQNKNPAARTVAETIRAQALAMDRKGDVSHSVLFFLLSVPKLSSARNTVEECCVTIVHSNFKIVSLSPFFVFCALLSSPDISLHAVTPPTPSADVRLSWIADGHGV